MTGLPVACTLGPAALKVRRAIDAERRCCRCPGGTRDFLTAMIAS
jgi:hypothetical protein